MTEVRFEAIAKHYGPVKAVDALSITIESGSFTTILGPSGSGKTTILSLIAGISRPTSGRIRLGARDITHLSAADRNIGLVFQSYALFPHMTIFDNIAFPLNLRGIPRDEVTRRVRETLDLVRLEGFETRKPDQLSGGQQQRVALARAVVFNPDILLLDEPLAALDRKLREEVRAELRTLQHRLGITTIMVTHDQEEALSLSDRIVLLKEGRIEQEGGPEDLYNRPATRFAANFLGMANMIEGSYADGYATNVAGDRLPCPVPGAGGTRIEGVLRPEAVHISAGEGPVLGVIDDVEFLGGAVRYGVQLPGGTRLVSQAPGAHQAFRDGQSVALSWERDAVWLLSKGGRAENLKVVSKKLEKLHNSTERITK